MKHSAGHLAGYTVLALLIIVVILAIVAIASPRHRRPVLRTAGWTLGSLAGLYAVIRGIAEFFVVNYNDPASYRDAWGGPSLAGVFAVHAGPGILFLISAITYASRKIGARRRMSRHPVGDGKGQLQARGPGTAQRS